uniref:Solute carrier family 26 member 11 n=1 Tax=Phasianus colchicus TaxID=9054 RepID=A0A669PXX9_PHACC
MWVPREPGQRWWQREVRRRLPVLGWLPRYSLSCLRLDLTAGVTVGLTVVPQALAYAEVAGLPVQYGLYSSFVGCFVYCLLGTAKDVTLGPTAIMSLLVSSYAFHDPAYAVLLAFLSGCIQLAMGLLHLGFLLDFVSCPVIKGFTSAASITISFNQVKNILGLQGIPRQFFLQVYETLRRIGETRAGDAILGLSCLAALAGLRAMKNRLHPAASTEPLATRASIPLVRSCATARNALVVLAAGLVAYSFQVSGSQPLTLTGSVPRGLPPFRPPPFSKAVPNGTVPFGRMVQDMGAGLAVVPLLGVLETVAIAKAFASQNDYRIDANQELLAMGTANILGSFFSSYPITGSFGRTAVNAQTGVCTPMGGLVTGTLVLLSLAYLTSLFCYIPKAALAAVIISAVVPMFDARIFRTLWRVKRLDLVPLCVTFLLCFWEVQYGIMAGMLVSGILLLYSVARPPIKHPHRALSSWMATTSPASTTRRWWGWLSCCRTCTSTASRWCSAACRTQFSEPCWLQTWRDSDIFPAGRRQHAVAKQSWRSAGQPALTAPVRAHCCLQGSSSEAEQQCGARSVLQELLPETAHPVPARAGSAWGRDVGTQERPDGSLSDSRIKSPPEGSPHPGRNCLLKSDVLFLEAFLTPIHFREL